PTTGETPAGMPSRRLPPELNARVESKLLNTASSAGTAWAMESTSRARQNIVNETARTLFFIFDLALLIPRGLVVRIHRYSPSVGFQPWLLSSIYQDFHFGILRKVGRKVGKAS